MPKAIHENFLFNKKVGLPSTKVLQSKAFYRYLQKQSSRSVLLKRCSENFRKIQKKTLVTELCFSKSPECNFTKIALRQGCCLVTFEKTFRTAFLQNA